MTKYTRPMFVRCFPLLGLLGTLVCACSGADSDVEQPPEEATEQRDDAACVPSFDYPQNMTGAVANAVAFTPAKNCVLGGMYQTSFKLLPRNAHPVSDEGVGALGAGLSFDGVTGKISGTIQPGSSPSVGMTPAETTLRATVRMCHGLPAVLASIFAPKGLANLKLTQVGLPYMSLGVLQSSLATDGIYHVPGVFRASEYSESASESLAKIIKGDVYFINGKAYAAPMEAPSASVPLQELPGYQDCESQVPPGLSGSQRNAWLAQCRTEELIRQQQCGDASDVIECLGSRSRSRAPLACAPGLTAYDRDISIRLTDPSPLRLVQGYSSAAWPLHQAESRGLQLQGGMGAQAFALAPGSSLPAGLALNAATGQISGIAQNTFRPRTVQVRVTDSRGRVLEVPLELAPSGGDVILRACAHANLQPPCLSIRALVGGETGERVSLAAPGIAWDTPENFSPNDNISSLWVAPGYRASLCIHAGFDGDCAALAENTAAQPLWNLAAAWNDIVSSLAVRPALEAFPGFNLAATYPGNSKNRWSEETTGVAHDERHWYITTGDVDTPLKDSQGKIFKYPITSDLNGAPLASVRLPGGCSHTGDPAFHGNYLYVPMDHCDGDPKVLVYNRDLSLAETLRVSDTNDLPFIAIDPITRLFYAYHRQNNTLHVYRKDGGNLVLDHDVRIDMPQAFRWVQGGEFSESGRFYLAAENIDSTNGWSNNSPGPGVFVFTIEGGVARPAPVGNGSNRLPVDNYNIDQGCFWQGSLSDGDCREIELQGLTLWDTSPWAGQIPGGIEGQVHLVRLNNNLNEKDRSGLHHFRLQNAAGL